MTLEDSHNPQWKSNITHSKNTNLQNKSDTRQSRPSIIDETLTSHLDACARASKVRERVPLLYPLSHPCQEQEIKNYTSTKNSMMTKSANTNFDKDRFQKLMTKRTSLAQMQANLCTKSWNVKNGITGGAVVENKCLDSFTSQSRPHYSLLSYKTRTTTTQQSSSPSHVQESLSNVHESDRSDIQPCDTQSRSKVTTKHSLLGHNIQPNSKLKLKELANRYHVPTSTRPLQRAVETSHMSENQLLETTLLDESLHCITVDDGDDYEERHCCQDENQHDDLTLPSHASFLDAVECCQDVCVSFSSGVVSSKEEEGNRSKKGLSRARIKRRRSGDGNGVNYLAQLQTLIGIQDNRKDQDINVTSTCNIWLGEQMSKATSQHPANDIHDSLKTIDQDLASVVSSQITFDCNYDKDQHDWRSKFGKGTNCSLLRYCLMVWFISLVLIYERSWSHEIYLLSSWRRIVEQSVREAIDSQMYNLENVTLLRYLSKSMDAPMNALQPIISCGQSYGKDAVVLIAPEEFQTVTRFKNDTMALNYSVDQYLIGDKSNQEIYDISIHQDRTLDTCGIDTIFYSDMTTSSSAKQHSILVPEINPVVPGVNNTLLEINSTEDTYSQQVIEEKEGLNVTSIVSLSEFKPRLDKVHFWSSRKYIPFMSPKLLHDDLIMLDSASNVSKSFFTKKKSSHGFLDGQSSIPEMQSFRPLEYLHSRHSLEDEDVSIIDMAMDFFRITIKAWKQRRSNRQQTTKNVLI